MLAVSMQSNKASLHYATFECFLRAFKTNKGCGETQFEINVRSYNSVVSSLWECVKFFEESLGLCKGIWTFFGTVYSSLNSIWNCVKFFEQSLGLCKVLLTVFGTV